MEVIGKIKVVQSVVDKGTFKIKNVVITTDEQYPQDISVQFVQDKCALLNNYKAGDEVKVSINLRGRMWLNPQGEEIYFNTIQGWKIENTAPAVENEDLPY